MTDEFLINGIPRDSAKNAWYWFKHESQLDDPAAPPVPYHWYDGKWSNGLVGDGIKKGNYECYGPCEYPAPWG